MKLYLFLILFNQSSCCVTNFQLPTANQVVILEKFYKVSAKPKKPKIRWKRIFRKITIFNKKWSSWMLIFGGIILGLGSFFYIADSNPDSELEGNIFYPIVGMFLLSILMSMLLIFITPIIWIVRFFQELRWRNRYSRCKKF